MLVAAKYEEMHPPDIASFVYISADTYNKDQILVCCVPLLLCLLFANLHAFVLLLCHVLLLIADHGEHAVERVGVQPDSALCASLRRAAAVGLQGRPEPAQPGHVLAGAQRALVQD